MMKTSTLILKMGCCEHIKQWVSVGKIKLPVLQELAVTTVFILVVNLYFADVCRYVYITFVT